MGRYWAVGPQIDDEEQREIIEQMRAWGATPAQIKQYEEKLKPDYCLVLSDNAEAVQWFLSVDDCFTFNSHTGFMEAFDIKAIYYDAQMRGMDPTPSLYNKLRIISRSAKNEFNKKRSDSL